MTDKQVVARSRTEAFARRIETAARAIGQGDAMQIVNSALNLASHAALAVALDARLINLIRVNFFVDEERLPYWIEAPLLLWGLCRDEGDGLYVMDGAIRDLLLHRLTAEYQPDRARKVATLLWQYAERELSWADRSELRHAQQLTAMSFIDREQAHTWLDQARSEAGEGSLSEDWFVAMREELPELPVLAREGGDPAAVSEALRTRLGIPLMGPISRQLRDELKKSGGLELFFHRSRDATSWTLYCALRELRVSAMFELTMRPGMSSEEFLRELSKVAGTPDIKALTATVAAEDRAGRRMAFVLNGVDAIDPAALRSLTNELRGLLERRRGFIVVAVSYGLATEFGVSASVTVNSPASVPRTAVDAWLEREAHLLKVPKEGLADSIDRATQGGIPGVLEHLCRACGVRWKDVLARTREPLIGAPPQTDPIRAIAAAYESAANAAAGNQTLATVWAAMSASLAAALRAQPEWPVAPYANSQLQGERLVAMLALQIRPSAEWIPWLVAQVEKEEPFSALQAIIALERACENLPGHEMPMLGQALLRVRHVLIDQGLSMKSNRYRTLIRAQTTLEQRRLGKKDAMALVALANSVVLPGVTTGFDASDVNVVQTLLQTVSDAKQVFALCVRAGVPSHIGTVCSVRQTKSGFRASGLWRARMIESDVERTIFVSVSPEPDAPSSVPAGFRKLLLDLNDIAFDDAEDASRLRRESDLALLCYWIASRLRIGPAALQGLLVEPSVAAKLEQVYILLRNAIERLDAQNLDASERQIVFRALNRADNEQLRLTASRFAPSASSQKRRGANYQQLRLWPNGATLRIKFLSGSQSLQEQVLKIARQWISVTSLRFEAVPRNSKEPGDIRIAFDTDAGSWSYVGVDARNVPLGEPTMNLGNLDKELFEGAVLKEFGHALGLLNEHQSPNARIAWNEAVILKDMSGPPNFWSKAVVRGNIMEQADSSIPYREFDPTSVMMYHVPAHWTTNSQAYTPSNRLTASDRHFIAKLYPRQQPQEQSKSKSKSKSRIKKSMKKKSMKKK